MQRLFSVLGLVAFSIAGLYVCSQLSSNAGKAALSDKSIPELETIMWDYADKGLYDDAAIVRDLIKEKKGLAA